MDTNDAKSVTLAASYFIYSSDYGSLSLFSPVQGSHHRNQLFSTGDEIPQACITLKRFVYFPKVAVIF